MISHALTHKSTKSEREPQAATPSHFPVKSWFSYPPHPLVHLLALVCFACIPSLIPPPNHKLRLMSLIF